MTIKHLVISGGGPVMFRAMGALQKLEQEKFWIRENLKSIYGTSAGAFVGLVISLNYDWETVNKYFIERPWHEAFPITPVTLFDAFGRKGLYEKSVMRKIFKPLFDAKDIPLTITMKQFYELTNIHLHLYTFELHKFEIVDISYTTHPDVEILDAVYMSCALPIVFSPFIIEDKCYLDGGVRTNYPLNNCIENEPEINTDEILGFKNIYDDNSEYTSDIQSITSDNSSIIDYVHLFFRKMVRNMDTENKQKQIKYEVTYEGRRLSLEYLQDVLSSQAIRSELLHTGIEAADNFLSCHNTKNNNEKEVIDSVNNLIQNSSKELS